MIILAVESSCDETSVAIVKEGKEILAHMVLSQIDIHQRFGGVVPEIASRNHVIHMTRIFEEAFKEARLKPKDIDLVAVTNGPGLIGSLLVGVNAASAFAFANHLPIMGVNHLIGHIYAANIEHDMKFPAIALLVSGGHTELLYLKNHLDVTLLGTTQDDAVGEAYDKVARMLQLGYPGGPIIDRLAANGHVTIDFPKAMIHQDNLDFSFSGLKSAVLNKINQLKQKNETIPIEDLCASFQHSVIEVLLFKTKKALEQYPVKQLILAGGVAANKGLRKRFTDEFKQLEVIIPSMAYCTDNAAMIGAAAYYYQKRDGFSKKYLLEVHPGLDF